MSPPDEFEPSRTSLCYGYSSVEPRGWRSMRRCDRQPQRSGPPGTRRLPAGADRVLLPDARFGFRCRRCCAGNTGAGVEGERQLRGAFERPLVVVPHCHQRLPRHAEGPPAPGAAHGNGPSRPPVDASLETFLPEGSWVSPIADDRVLPLEADPATLAEERESIRLAFIAALQHLPARQRAVLVLCEVLRWQASEVADLLDTSVPAVNSALQRARATLATLDAGPRQPVMDAGQRELLARYVDAFERFDVDELVGLLHKDAVQSMPPYAMWLLGSEDIGRFMLGPGHGCRGSKLVPVHANGSPAFGHYKPGPEGGYVPWAIVVLEISGDRISGIHSFLEADRLFPEFGLPLELSA